MKSKIQIIKDLIKINITALLFFVLSASLFTACIGSCIRLNEDDIKDRARMKECETHLFNAQKSITINNYIVELNTAIVCYEHIKTLCDDKDYNKKITFLNTFRNQASEMKPTNDIEEEMFIQRLNRIFIIEKSSYRLTDTRVSNYPFLCPSSIY